MSALHPGGRAPLGLSRLSSRRGCGQRRFGTRAMRPGAEMSLLDRTGSETFHDVALEQDADDREGKDRCG